MRTTSLILIVFCSFLSRELFGGTSHSKNISNKGTYISEQAIVFDWDDTLLPTSFIKKNFRNGDSCFDHLREIFKLYLDEWKEFDSFVSEFLSELNQNSDLYIISNSEPDWIKISSSTLMPHTNSILLQMEKENRLISAKAFYFGRSYKAITQETIVTTLNDWKKYTYANILNNYKTIISLGDGYSERSALFSIPLNENQKMLRKNIKLLDLPESIDLLLTQLKFIRSKWASLAQGDEKIDFYISEDLNAFVEFE